MHEIESLSNEAYLNILPDKFLEDPELYCRAYGQQEYHRLINLVTCITSVRLTLNNGDKLNYQERVTVWEPLSVRASRN